MARVLKSAKPKAVAKVARPAAARPREHSEAFDTFARDLLTFAGHFERTSTKRVATGGVGKKTTQRIAPFLRRSDEDYASFLGVFLIDRRVLFEGEDRWEISRQNLMRLWQPERLLRSVYHFWLRAALWNESLADPDVLSLVRREYISPDPTLEARRRRLCEELASARADGTIDLATLLSRLDRSLQGRGRAADDGGMARHGGRVSPAALLRRMLGGPLAWLGVVEPAVRRPAGPHVESFRVTSLGRAVLAEGWPAII